MAAGATGIITRREWGARSARAVSGITGTRGVKIHYTGSPESPAMRDDHARCVARVQAIQAHHMDANGWSDIAYNLLVCIHGHVFLGRGPGVLTAANGPGLNRAHYAVCALVGTKGLADPSPAMLEGLCRAIAYLRQYGGAGAEVKGHRDGYATTCPGDRLYAWVRDGAPCPGEGDEVPEYVSVALGGPVELQADDWTTVVWRDEASDRAGQHADGGGADVLSGPAAYGLTAQLRIRGLPPGADLQVRAVEEGGGVVRGGALGEFKATGGDTFALFNLAADKINEGQRLRLRVLPIGHAGTLVAATCKIHFWR